MKIDVWYDVICPWCWLGKARLDAAVKDLPDVEIVSHSFELDTKSPKDLDVPTTELVMKKYGMPRAQIDEMHERMASMGREVGIEYAFDKVRSSNTFEAHQLVHLARAHGGEAKANAMAERLFRANFQEGLRVGSRDVLVRLAKEAGIEDAEKALEEERYARAVRADESDARELGVNGVPFFVIAEKFAISGAQTVEVLREALARAS